MSTPTQPTDRALARKLLPFMRKDAPLYILALVAAPLSAAIAIAQPYLLKVAIDDHITTGDISGLESIAFLYLGAVVLSFIMESGYTITISYAAMRTIARLRGAIYSHTLRLSRAFFDREPTGRLLTRTTSDVEALGETLTAGAITIVLDILMVIGILIAMFSLDVKFTLVMLALAPILALVINAIRRILRRLYLSVRTTMADLNAFTAERLEGVRLVQLYGDEGRANRAYNERVDAYRSATVRTNVWDALLFAFVDGLTSISLALILWYGGLSSLEGAVTAGLLAAFIEYINRLFQPIREFSQKVAVIQRAVTALEKIFGLLDRDEHITAGTRKLPRDSEGALVVGPIRLRDVSFSYSDDADDVLKNVSLDLNPGEVVAVVGRTGSGKSTLGRLLVRAYQGYRGSITVGGVELADLDLDDARRGIGMVQQDVQLFPGDVRFNLTLGQDVPDDALWEVIRLARAERAVEKLGGLDGRVAHKGANLSVGEGQLLAFARTLAHDPPVVILDEATASVDSLTEAEIQAATEAVLARKTTLVIAHRLSTIVNADRIAVMDAGVIVELGPHRELMEKDGVYAQLFHAQFDDEVVEA